MKGYLYWFGTIVLSRPQSPQNQMCGRGAAFPNKCGLSLTGARGIGCERVPCTECIALPEGKAFWLDVLK